MSTCLRCGKCFDADYSPFCCQTCEDSYPQEVQAEMFDMSDMFNELVAQWIPSLESKIAQLESKCHAQQCEIAELRNELRRSTEGL